MVADCLSKCKKGTRKVANDAAEYAAVRGAQIRDKAVANYERAKKAETREEKMMVAKHTLSLMADVSLAKDAIELSAAGARALAENAASVPYVGQKISGALLAYAGLVDEFEVWLRGSFEAAFQGDIKQFAKVANKCRFEMTKRLAELPFVGSIARQTLLLELAIKSKDKKAIARHGGTLLIELLMITLPVKPRAEGIVGLGEGAAEIAAEAAQNFAVDFEKQGGIDKLRSGELKTADVASLFGKHLAKQASAKVVRFGVAGGIKMALKALVLPDAFHDFLLDGPFTPDEIAREFTAAAGLEGEEAISEAAGLELDLGEDPDEGCCERGRRDGGFFSFLFCCSKSEAPRGRPPELEPMHI